VLWLGSKIKEELTREGKRLCEVWIDKEKRATVEGMHEGVRLLRHGEARRGGRGWRTKGCVRVCARTHAQVRFSRHFLLFLTREVRNDADPVP
jgi:hypothetical protein